MAKDKHTGGEDAMWEADGRDVVCVLGDARVVVARVPGSVAPDEQHANARMMAAAPEMLRALRKVVHAPHAKDLPTEIVEACARIISRATGGEG